MTPFLSSLGGKLAERWVATLLLPGAGFVLATGCASLLGHGHALDAGLLATELRALTDGNSGGARIAVLAIVFLLAAAGAGLAARALGRVVETVWIGRWRGPAALIARPLVALRGRRAARAAAKAGVTTVLDYRPQLPTWMGEQFRLLNARVAAQYQGLRLALIWPRLWMLVADPVRGPVQAVNGQFHATTVLAGWGLLYLFLGAWWFPAAAIGLTTLAVAWRRGRTHTAALATLMESIVDTHLGQLATALNVTIAPTGLTSEVAMRINDQLHKGD